MVDYHVDVVCSMCGDVGFPDKLFHCSNGCNRFQHSYCSSNYYSGISEAIEMCDWCKREEEEKRVVKQCGEESASSSSRKFTITAENVGGGRRLVINNDRKEAGSSERRKNNDQSGGTGTGTPSPRTTATRRYKLLKDVMC